MIITNVRIAVAASLCSISAARIPSRILNACNFDDFALHIGRLLTTSPFYLAFASMRKRSNCVAESMRTTRNQQRRAQNLHADSTLLPSSVGENRQAVRTGPSPPELQQLEGVQHACFAAIAQHNQAHDISLRDSNDLPLSGR